MGRSFEFQKAHKMKRWANMFKTFTKFGRQISMVVTQGGADLGNNSILHMIVQNAKGANIPISFAGICLRVSKFALL